MERPGSRWSVQEPGEAPSQESFEARDEEVPGDARYGFKVLELCDFDDVDGADALLAAPVAEVDHADAEMAGLVVGPRLAVDPEQDSGLTGRQPVTHCSSFAHLYPHQIASNEE